MSVSPPNRSLLLRHVPRTLVRLPRLVRRPKRRIHRVLVPRRRVHCRKCMRRGRPAREESRRGGGARGCRVIGLRGHDIKCMSGL